jgi:hypothetical protein
MTAQRRRRADDTVDGEKRQGHIALLAARDERPKGGLRQAIKWCVFGRGSVSIPMRAATWRQSGMLLTGKGGVMDRRKEVILSADTFTMLVIYIGRLLLSPQMTNCSMALCVTSKWTGDVLMMTVIHPEGLKSFTFTKEDIGPFVYSHEDDEILDE